MSEQLDPAQDQFPPNALAESLNSIEEVSIRNYARAIPEETLNAILKVIWERHLTTDSKLEEAKILFATLITTLHAIAEARFALLYVDRELEWQVMEQIRSDPFIIPFATRVLWRRIRTISLSEIEEVHFALHPVDNVFCGSDEREIQDLNQPESSFRIVSFDKPQGEEGKEGEAWRTFLYDLQVMPVVDSSGKLESEFVEPSEFLKFLTDIAEGSPSAFNLPYQIELAKQALRRILPEQKRLQYYDPAQRQKVVELAEQLIIDPRRGDLQSDLSQLGFHEVALIVAAFSTNVEALTELVEIVLRSLAETRHVQNEDRAQTTFNTLLDRVDLDQIPVSTGENIVDWLLQTHFNHSWIKKSSVLGILTKFRLSNETLLKILLLDDGLVTHPNFPFSEIESKAAEIINISPWRQNREVIGGLQVYILQWMLKVKDREALKGLLSQLESAIVNEDLSRAVVNQCIWFYCVALGNPILEKAGLEQALEFIYTRTKFKFHKFIRYPEVVYTYIIDKEKNDQGSFKYGNIQEILDSPVTPESALLEIANLDTYPQPDLDLLLCVRKPLPAAVIDLLVERVVKTPAGSTWIGTELRLIMQLANQKELSQKSIEQIIHLLKSKQENIPYKLFEAPMATVGQRLRMLEGEDIGVSGVVLQSLLMDFFLPPESA